MKTYLKSSEHWDRDETEKLIQLWKATPELLMFKTDRNLYKTKLNDVTSEMQGVRFGTTEKDIRKRMKNLRTQYSREKKRVLHGLEVKLWCYEDLKFLDGENKEDTNQSNDSICSKKIKENQTIPFPVDQQMQVNGLSNFTNKNEGVNSNCATLHYEVDQSNLLETINPAKRLRKNEDSFDEDNDLTSPMESEWEETYDTENKNISQSLIVKLEQTIGRSNTVLSRMTNVKDSNHRAFVENLLHEMNRMPENTLRTIKWNITDIVYEAYQDHEKRINTALNS